MTQQFIIETNGSTQEYQYDGDLFSLGNKLTELKATKLHIPNDTPPYAKGQIRKAIKTMKRLILSMDDGLHWIKGSVGNSGSYSDKYKEILPDDFVESDGFTELMDKVDQATKLVKEINKIVDSNIIFSKNHKAHYYVQWKK